MTAPGGGEPYRDQPGPWQPYQHPPVDPQAPVNYPEYPYPSPYASYPPPPPPYPGPYDPYLGYQAQQTNGLAVASLVTSIAGVLFGIPLAIFCYVGWLIPVVGAIMGAIALGQIKQRGQQGRGLAIAGIAIGVATAALLVLGMIIVAAAAFHSPMFGVA